MSAWSFRMAQRDPKNKLSHCNVTFAEYRSVFEGWEKSTDPKRLYCSKCVLVPDHKFCKFYLGDVAKSDAEST